MIIKGTQSENNCPGSFQLTDQHVARSGTAVRAAVRWTGHGPSSYGPVQAGQAGQGVAGKDH